MKRLLLILPLLLLAPATHAESNSLAVDTADIHTKTCPADGTTAPSVTLTTGRSTWFVTVQSETVFLCQATTCPSGGVPLVVGTQLKMQLSGTVSCRSAGGTGVLTFNAAAL